MPDWLWCTSVQTNEGATLALKHVLQSVDHAPVVRKDHQLRRTLRISLCLAARLLRTDLALDPSTDL